jgi:dihydroorotate dehydrogenase (fumarate)
MAELTTSYLGIELRSPIVASAGPHTGNLASLERLEDHGVAAVVLPSLFEEEIVDESLQLHETLEQGVEQNPETVGYFPEMDFFDLGPQRHLRLLEQAKKKLSIPVIASVNALSPGSWSRYATEMADAGADAIELNLYAVPSDPARPGTDVESGYLATVREVRAAVSVPLAVKLSAFFSSTGHFARQAVDAGAGGLVLFNRFYQPDLDLETLEVQPLLELSHPWELRLPLRWIAIMRSRLPETSLAATTGVHSGTDVAKALLVGADVAMMTSALLRHGPEHVEMVERQLLDWMDEHEYESVGQLQGSVSQSAITDPTAFERANYIRVLSSVHLPHDGRP